MSDFVFTSYDENDLRACGKAFEAEYAPKGLRLHGVWTKSVLQWFADKAPDGVRVYDHANSKEYMLDQCHLLFQKEEKEPSLIKRWEEFLSSRNECPLQARA